MFYYNVTGSFLLPFVHSGNRLAVMAEPSALHAAALCIKQPAKMKQFFCLLALLWVNISNAQANNNIKPLHIGDAIPAGIQLTGITNFPVSKIQLSDYNSKLLILDFWATWCSSCIQQFPKINALAKEFEGKRNFYGSPATQWRIASG